MSTADLKQLHEEFIAEARFANRLSSETLRGYSASFELLMRWNPDITAQAMSPALLREFFRWIETRERHIGSKNTPVRGVRASTIRTYWMKISRFLDWLVGRGYLGGNPLKCAGMAPPSVQYEDIKFMRRAEIQRILASVGFNIPWKNALVKNRNLAMLVLTLNCGLRKRELLGLTLTDLDLDNRLVIIRSQTSKSRRQRTVPLNSASVRALWDYLRERQALRYTTASLWVSERVDAGISDGGFRHAVECIRRASGVRFHMHQLRHTFAMNYAKTSGNPYALQHLLGHRNVATTTIYTRNMPTDALRSDVEQVGNLDNLL